jgi:hypothetical protein
MQEIYMAGQKMMVRVVQVVLSIRLSELACTTTVAALGADGTSA